MMVRQIVLPHALNFNFIALPGWAESFDTDQDLVAKAKAVFGEYLPPNTELTIEENHYLIGHKYIVRLRYTSGRSGRSMSLCAKGNELPTEPGQLLTFYLRQLILTPSQVDREFNRQAWMIRRARQDAFLSAGKSSNIRVADETLSKDLLNYREYA